MKVAINGLGRIGRAVLKIIQEDSEFDLVAINDLVPPDNLAYLLKYDTVYSRYEKEVEFTENSLTIAGKEYQMVNEKDPAKLPWKQMDIDVVFECTGIFTKKEDLAKHIEAKRVDPTLMTSHTFKFDDMEKAFHLMETKEEKVIKPLIVFGNRTS